MLEVIKRLSAKRTKTAAADGGPKREKEGGN